MRILDSNLLIYSALPEYAYLRALIKDTESCVSGISKVEVLGFHRLDSKSKQYFENVFFCLHTLPISDSILETAVALRQQRKLSLGDAIIAATAIEYDYELYTRNTADFSAFPQIKIINPVE
jgi:toxin FitB